MHKKSIKTVFPILNWGFTYKKSYLQGDIQAGLTVGIILIPQGIAYAMIAGLPAVYGLYTALIPQLVYAIFGSSKTMAPGPVVLDSLIIASGLSTLATIGTDNFVSLAITLTFMVGAIQTILGLFSLGFVTNFISKPVLTGFTSAAALIIILNQFKNLFGLSMSRNNRIQHILSDFFINIESIDWRTSLMGLLGIFAILGIRKINKKIPGPLFIVILGILTLKYNPLFFHSVSYVGKIPSNLPPLSLPVFDWSLYQELLPLASTLAFIGFVQSISVAKSIQDPYDKDWVRGNQEFLAIGLGNIAGSFFSSYTSTGSFSRSSLNQELGAKTNLTNIIAALVIVFTLLFITSWFFYLPTTILAAIIITSVINLIKWREIAYYWKADKKDFIMMAITLIVTITVGIKEGVVTGVVLSLLVLLFQSTRPHIAVLGKVPGTTHFYRNINRFQKLEVDPKYLIIRLDSQLFFVNTSFFRWELENQIIAKGTKLQAVIIDSEAINGIDSTGLLMLQNLKQDLTNRGLELYFTTMKGPVRDAFYKSDLISFIGFDNTFMSIQEAVDYFNGQSSKLSNYREYLDQANI